MRKAQIMLAIAAVLILAGFTYLVVNSGITTQRLDVKTIKLQSTEAKLKDVNFQVEQLKTQSSQDKAKQEEYQKQLEQKDKEKQELEAKLQAKADAKAKLELAAAQVEKAISPTQTASAMAAPVKQTVAAAPSYSGSHEDWMAAAGIAASDYGFVDYIVKKESGWNPSAVNASSGACGLGQQLPCGKWAGAWNDPVAALIAMQGYAIGRYGSWAGAYNYWISHNWW